MNSGYLTWMERTSIPCGYPCFIQDTAVLSECLACASERPNQIGVLICKLLCLVLPNAIHLCEVRVPELDSPIPCCCKCCFGAGGRPKQDDEFVCCNALHWFVCLGQSKYGRYVRGVIAVCTSCRIDRIAKAYVRIGATLALPRGADDAEISVISLVGWLFCWVGVVSHPFFLSVRRICCCLQYRCIACKFQVDGWLQHPPTGWTCRFHRDPTAWSGDPRVFVDKGRPMPDGSPALLKTRQCLSRGQAEQMWRDLLRQGWKRVPAVWGLEEEP